MRVKHTLHLDNPTGIFLAILTPLNYLLWLNAVTGSKSAKVGFMCRLPNKEVNEQLDFIKRRLRLLRNLGTNSQEKKQKENKERFP